MTVINSIRHAAKRAVSRKEFRWLGGPARRVWYYWRSTSELARAPAVLAGINDEVRSKPVDELVDLVFERFDGMFRPFQNKVELRRLIERAATIKPTTIIEIGTARGGTLFLLSCVAGSNARIVSVDLPAGQYGGGYPSWKGLLYRRLVGAGRSLKLIRGNSHSEATFRAAVRALDGTQVDLLFIDGDHTYEGAKQDFLRYRELVRPGGLVVFHDILDSVIDTDVTVAPLWREIRQEFRTEEIVDSYEQGQFGIGVIIAPDRWPSPAVVDV